jgi:hypothetical protein
MKLLNIHFVEEDGKISLSFNTGLVDYEKIVLCKTAIINFLEENSEKDVEDYNKIGREYWKNELEKTYINISEKKKKIKGYIYIYKQDKYYKIGRSKRLDCRKTKYITENPRKIELIRVYESEDCESDESILHNKFLSKKHNREWFLLLFDDIKLIDNLFIDKKRYG